MSLIFTCPKCGRNRLAEIMTNVVVSSEVLFPNDGSNFPTYESQSFALKSTDEGLIDRYQCMGCSEVIRNKDGHPIDNQSDIKKWLEENQPHKSSQLPPSQIAITLYRDAAMHQLVAWKDLNAIEDEIGIQTDELQNCLDETCIGVNDANCLTDDTIREILTDITKERNE